MRIMKKNKITVMVLSYNNFDLINKLISVFETKIIPHLSMRVIILDNGSQDNTKDCKINSSFIKIIRLDNNRYFSGGANYLFDQLETEHCFFMSSDITPNLKSFKLIINWIKENPTIGICGCTSKLRSGEIQQIAKPHLKLSQIHALHGCIQLFPFIKKRVIGSYLNYKPSNKDTDFVIQDSFIYLRGALIQKGIRYDEKMSLYYTEDDICKQVIKSGYGISILENCFVKHISGATADQSTKSVSRIYQKDAVSYVKKYYGAFYSSILFVDILSWSILFKIRKLIKK